MSEISRYDLIVIGSGPAGEKGASTAAALGKRVALIEKDPFVGGASTNTGTLPSKTLRETALALSGLKARELYGVDLSLRRQASVQDFMFHEGHVKTQERLRVREVLRHWNVDFYEGIASFDGPTTVRVAGASSVLQLEGDNILLATGSSPVRPALFPFDDPRIHDSDEILSIAELPHSLAVVGAGVIGSEYACTFAALGVQVHLIDGRDVLLPFLDREVSTALTQAIERLGVVLHRPVKITGCDTTAPGAVKLTGDNGIALEADHVLVAAGRCSNVATLNLEAAGVVPGPRGLIRVDEAYRTSVPHIFAAGDIVGFPALAATSAEQARVAVCHAFGYQRKLNMAHLLPTGIYTIPEVSMVGETEETLQEKGIPYVVGRARYDRNARGQIIGDRHGFLKLIFSDEAGMKLLGAHCIGELASEVVHTGLMAMLTGSGADLFSQACFNYPTLGDLYKTATYDAMVRRGLDKD